MPVDLHTVFDATRDGDATLERRMLGTLVHGGFIVACDPLTGENDPFARKFPAGAHPVEVLVRRADNDERVALARVVFAPGVPTSFELATRGAEDIRSLAPGQRFGYGVDAGVGCFGQIGAVESVDSDDLLEYLEGTRKMTWCWAAAFPTPGGHRLIAFSSGYGDGIYASYVGFSAAGEPLSLVTDFKCIDELDLTLPDAPDDQAYRRNKANEMYAKLKSTERDYASASELAASPADAAHLVEPLLADLRAAHDQVERDLYLFVLPRLFKAPAAQRFAAPHLAKLPDPILSRLLVCPDEIDPLWLETARSLWSRRSARSCILNIELQAAKGAHDPRVTQHAIEALDDDENEQLVETALRVFRDLDVRNGKTLDARTVEALRAIAEHPPNARVHHMAFELMLASGVDLEPSLTSPSPETRRAAAIAISKQNPTRADAILVAIVDDSKLERDLRFESAGRIHDQPTRIRAYLTMGLAGHEAAPIQLRYIGGAAAIAALERLVKDAKAAAVRQQAVKYLAVAREIDANRQSSE